MPKDNPFTENPFGAQSNGDPFAAQAASAPQPQSNGWGGGGAWGANNGSAYNAASTSSGGAFSVPPATSEGYSVPKREDLEAKERQLAAKEAELAKWEENLKATGALKPKKNWPVCLPILHHDIAGEVPADKQRMVTWAYWSFLGLIWCMLFNCFASLMAMCVISPADSRLAGFLMSVVYIFAGLPGAWVLWYRRVYNASRNDRAFTYLFFFLFYLVNIGWCAWAAVSPPIPFGFSKWALAGYVAGIKAFSDSVFVGVVFVVGASFWAIEGLWSLWVLKTVYFSFRNGGGNNRLKQEAATSAVKIGLSSKARKTGGKMPMSMGTDV